MGDTDTGSVLLPHRKRPKVEVEGAGAGAVLLGFQQVAKIKTTKKVFGSKAYAEQQALQMQKKYFIANWRNLTRLYGTATNLSIGLKYKATSTTGVNELPMLAWDLTSLPQGFNHANVGTLNEAPKIWNYPCYKLQKAMTGEYSWTNTIQDAVPAPPTGDTWERCPTDPQKSWSIVNANTTPGQQPIWITAWAEIKMIMMGAITRPTKFHVHVVRFCNSAVGPRRTYVYDDSNDPVVVQTLDTPDTNQIQAAQVFWDQWFSQKLNNPIYKTFMPNTDNRNLEILHHETFNIGPEDSSNLDTRGRTIIKDFFFELNKASKAPRPAAVKQNSTYWQIGVTSNTGSTTTTPSLLKDYEAGGIFGSYEDNMWFLVSADNYLVNEEATQHIPTFDIDITVKNYVVN